MMTMNSSEKKLTHKDLMGIFWRSFRQDAVWNFERQQNLGSAYTMSRVVGKLYEDNKEIKAFIGINKGHIEGIFVEEKYRNQGIGKEL